jgi:hypothetical protein
VFVFWVLNGRIGDEPLPLPNLVAENNYRTIFHLSALQIFALLARGCQATTYLEGGVRLRLIWGLAIRRSPKWTLGRLSWRLAASSP